jgi:hypothetical protein
MSLPSREQAIGEAKDAGFKYRDGEWSKREEPSSKKIKIDKVAQKAFQSAGFHAKGPMKKQKSKSDALYIRRGPVGMYN